MSIQCGKTLLFNLLKSELQYYTPFWNASATNEGVSAKWTNLAPNWLPWQNFLSNREMNDQFIKHFHSSINTENLVNISLPDSKIAGL